jgi:DNA-directed RNA polymerase specialized sigma24 family protein
MPPDLPDTTPAAEQMVAERDDLKARLQAMPENWRKAVLLVRLGFPPLDAAVLAGVPRGAFVHMVEDARKRRREPVACNESGGAVREQWQGR